ncbi:MAG: hypothetical protein H6710_06680 [Myxococcales bacterium]|nr:hypothetical protein [Myxococcales bacterium]
MPKTFVGLRRPLAALVDRRRQVAADERRSPLPLARARGDAEAADRRSGRALGRGERLPRERTAALRAALRQRLLVDLKGASRAMDHRHR